MKTRKVKGVLISSQLIQLEEPLVMPAGTPVEVEIDPSISEVPTPLRGSLESLLATLNIIHVALQKTGFEPPTREAIDMRVREERDSWECEEGMRL